jgi:transcriptional regulator with XRE-family HTH domain
MTANIRFDDWLDEQMQDPAFRAAMEELEPAYQVARLRIVRGLTQKELAKLVGTRQSSISRLESGKAQPSISFLRRVIEALGGRLVIQVRDAPVPTPCLLPETTTDSDADLGILVPEWPLPAIGSLPKWTAQSSETSVGKEPA